MGGLTRRELLTAGAAAAIGSAASGCGHAAGSPASLDEVPYEAVTVIDPTLAAQRANVTGVLLGLPEDGLLKPFRAMSGRVAPGPDLGGWYTFKPAYNYRHDDAGLAPGATLGQWCSAMSRLSAGGGPPTLREKALRLRGLLHESIGQGYFARTRFPAYSYDKLVCGLLDAHRLSGDGRAWDTLDRVTRAAGPSLPGHAVDRDIQSRPGRDLSWMWDESFTLPENLYLAWSLGAGSRYRRMAERYLDDRTFFEPLARGQDALVDRQAYSYVNALCSGMQAWLTGGSAMHLSAARHGFDILERQSFVTGGWGPDEQLGPGGPYKSLAAGHNSFETPCGGYAHLKLTRYLLRATGEGRYGDSLERVLWNTVAGALPLGADGRSFYNADYSWTGKRVYSEHRWPCCSGTLPQVAADHGINGYLRSPGQVWAVLYTAGALRWEESGAPVRLEQEGAWLEDGAARMRVKTPRPLRFELRLRVPGWAASHRVLVNGAPVETPLEKGFAVIAREWRDGDTVELRAPFALRLETMPGHPEIAALLWGPRVLFALRAPEDLVAPLFFKADALLRAERTGPSEWRVGDRVLTPWTEVGARLYSTYVRLA